MNVKPETWREPPAGGGLRSMFIKAFTMGDHTARKEEQLHIRRQGPNEVVKRTHTERYSTELKLHQLQLDSCCKELKALKEDNQETPPSLEKERRKVEKLEELLKEHCKHNEASAQSTTERGNVGGWRGAQPEVIVSISSGTVREAVQSIQPAETTSSTVPTPHWYPSRVRKRPLRLLLTLPLLPLVALNCEAFPRGELITTHGEIFRGMGDNLKLVSVRFG